jgi:hypothetical protein
MVAVSRTDLIAYAAIAHSWGQNIVFKDPMIAGPRSADWCNVSQHLEESSRFRRRVCLQRLHVGEFRRPDCAERGKISGDTALAGLLVGNEADEEIQSVNQRLVKEFMLQKGGSSIIEEFGN